MKDLTINLLRILNWNNTQSDTKIQIQFISAHNRAHIAHKSILANFYDNSIILNSAFKISYHQNQNHIICKVSIIKQHKVKEVVGEAEIDLDCFMERKIYFVTFQDHDKVIEIHKAQELNQDQLSLELNQTRNVNKLKISQDQFLQERFNFLDKVSKKQAQLKRDFSQKVYNLLKDVKYARPQVNSKKSQGDHSYSKDYYEQNSRGHTQNSRGHTGYLGHLSKDLKQDQDPKFVTPQKASHFQLIQDKSSKKKTLQPIGNKYTSDQNQTNYQGRQKAKNINLMINSLQVLQKDEKGNRQKQIKLERQAILNQIKEDALMEKYYQRQKRKK